MTAPLVTPDPTRVCPECAQGKHVNCTDEVLADVEGIEQCVECSCAVWNHA